MWLPSYYPSLDRRVAGLYGLPVAIAIPAAAFWLRPAIAACKCARTSAVSVYAVSPAGLAFRLPPISVT